MAHKTVFLDRDHTLIEDPGYIADPSAVKLLPGVEIALKWLAQAGFKLVIVTNQSGVARGLITEQQLESIHQELRRQLAQHGTHVDAIYFCPFHPEGTVEKYAMNSPLRKPQPGMLRKAADELDIDLSNSWMIGDSPHDIEAGQRAGCRTIRLRAGSADSGDTHPDEDVQADFTVRNIVEAARVILMHPSVASAQVPPSHQVTAEQIEPPLSDMVDDRQFRQEVLRHLRNLARASREEFSFTKLLGGIIQVLVLLSLLLAIWKHLDAGVTEAIFWAQIAAVLQIMALTFFVLHRTH